MRRTVNEQLALVPAQVDHAHARELIAIGKRLDNTPEAAELIYSDLMRHGANPNRGRKGMSAEQVLRCTVAKQLNQWSYEELTFHLGDSLSYRVFCRFGPGDGAPKKSTLKRNLKRVRAETWEAINRLLLGQAKDDGIERGRKVRSDCTVEETNIHAPSDSSLLWDCVRVLARMMTYARERVPVHFVDHRRRAKRRYIAIGNVATMAKRLPLYRDLLKVTHRTVGYAVEAAKALDKYRGGSIVDQMAAAALADDLRHYVELARRVIDQTQRRVLGEEAVPANEKLVSIFEPHTDIIVKDRRETYYGHKLALTTGASGLVLDCVVQEGNPCDSTLATNLVKRQKQIYGRVPRQVSFDGGFASKANVKSIKRLGVKDVCFSKCRFLKVSDMVKSTWVYRKLRRFRAGIEAGISFLKRCFGLDRCTWKGLASFKAYTWASVISHNLLVLARHTLA
jgi:IS5 family transposase